MVREFRSSRMSIEAGIMLTLAIYRNCQLNNISHDGALPVQGSLYARLQAGSCTRGAQSCRFHPHALLSSSLACKAHLGKLSATLSKTML